MAETYETDQNNRHSVAVVEHNDDTISTSPDTFSSASGQDSICLFSFPLTPQWASLSLAVLPQIQHRRRRPHPPQNAPMTHVHPVALSLAVFSRHSRSRPRDRECCLPPLPYRPDPNRRSETRSAAGGSRVDATLQPTSRELSLNIWIT